MWVPFASTTEQGRPQGRPPLHRKEQEQEWAEQQEQEQGHQRVATCLTCQSIQK